MEPPVLRDSTTMSTSLSAAMMRLRMGKRNGSGCIPGGASETRTPRVATSSHMRLCSRGYTTSSPEATTAIGGTEDSPVADSTPRCDSTSIPRARPDTTATPAVDNCAPSVCAKYFPLAVAARVPMMPTRRFRKISVSPRTKRTAGASGSPMSEAGYDGLLMVRTSIFLSIHRSATVTNKESSTEPHARHTALSMPLRKR